jgi:hypothetical protein
MAGLLRAIAAQEGLNATPRHVKEISYDESGQ